jgi:hypothetical protein
MEKFGPFSKKIKFFCQTERGILEDILIFEYLGFLYLEDHEVLE